MRPNATALQILSERFGKDSLIALATFDGAFPSVRTVDAWYEDGCFICVTNARSNKMRQIAANAHVGVAGEWFTGHALAENLGPFSAPENARLAARLREAFALWLDNGHTDPADPDTIILRLRLVDGLLLSHGARYELEF